MAGNTLKSFSCPNCDSSVQIRTVGLSLSVVCGSCKSIIDIKNENYKILQNAQNVITSRSIIPLGQRGQLLGTLWEVIGYMERVDGTETYFWSEYLLFNPSKGFAWLTEANGHWNFVHKLRNIPKIITDRKVNLLGKDYEIFTRGTAKVRFVLGEFYWKVKVGEKTQVEDYIRPPEILSLEETKDEKTWSIGQYIEADQVKNSFQITEMMPWQSGVSPNQMSHSARYSDDVVSKGIMFVSILCLFQFAMLIMANSKADYIESFSYNKQSPALAITSNNFKLASEYSNLEIELRSDVENDWIEIGVDIVNNETGESREVEIGNEFYSGYDSDGRWTEGSKSENIVISGMPKGDYHLNIQVVGAGVGSSVINYTVILTHGVLTWKNFFIFLALIGIIPVIVWWRRRSFEVSRWSESDFSPFPSHKENS